MAAQVKPAVMFNNGGNNEEHIFLSLVFLAILSSCTEDVSITVQNNAVPQIEKGLTKNITSKLDTLEEDRPIYYSYIEHVWYRDHYLPKSGKTLGISTKFASQSEYGILKTRWGFSNIRISNDTQRDWALNQGFNINQLMAGVHVHTDGSFSYASGNFSYYDLDEPFERDDESGPQYPLSVEEVVTIANSINSSAKLCLTAWKLLPNLVSTSEKYLYRDVLNQTTNTEMMCDQYYDEGIWPFDCGNDQRDHWTFFKNFYSASRVKSYWIHLLVDGMQDDFDRLFGHANNLGINKLWIYAGDAEGWCDNIELQRSDYDFYIELVCKSAWENGWLRRFEREYVLHWRCDGTYDECYRNIDPNNEDIPPGPLDNWYLESTVPTDNIREVFATPGQ